VSTYGYARTLKAMRGGATLRVDFGLNTTCGLDKDVNGSPAFVTVRFDSFQKLLTERAIVERRRYKVQPPMLFVYDIAKE
jgi:hypothetical protein